MKSKKTIMALIMLAVFAFLATSAAWAEEKATREECVAMCKKAAALVQEVGVEQALAKIGEPNGDFVWKDSYVFVIDLDSATNVAHPVNPKLVGKSLMAMKDTNGKMFFAEFVEVAKNQGEGWVDYTWPKPGETTPSNKVSYVLRIPDTNLAALAGIYE